MNVVGLVAYLAAIISSDVRVRSSQRVELLFATICRLLRSLCRIIVFVKDFRVEKTLLPYAGEDRWRCPEQVKFISEADRPR